LTRWDFERWHEQVAMTVVELREDRPPTPTPTPTPPTTPPTTQRWPPQTRLELLGRFRLVVDGEDVELPAPARRLLAYLALRDRAQPRLLVAGTLWPDKSDERACANLRASVWRAHGPDRRSLVSCSGSTIALARHLAVDVTEMERLGWGLVDGDIGAPPRSSCRLFYDDLLPGWYDDWLLFDRERFAQLRICFLEALVERLADERRHAEAVDVGLHLVVADDHSPRSQQLVQRVLTRPSDGACAACGQ
jgi:DNA-binding SARP family transcriptional activator